MLGILEGAGSIAESLISLIAGYKRRKPGAGDPGFPGQMGMGGFLRKTFKEGNSPIQDITFFSFETQVKTVFFISGILYKIACQTMV